ncbi:MAG TPA: lamin tail domain-containing protein [Minicystis sp.]|nr:lamin tail domain-containing protein [Minicystis sp.]
MSKLTLLVPLAAAAAVVAAFACEPQIPLPGGTGGGGASGDGGPAAAFALAVEPAAPLDATPPVLWLRLDDPPLGTEATRVVVATGVLSPTHLRELATYTVSEALSERLVPTVAWAAADGAIYVAPTEALAPGGMYTVALEDLRLMTTFQVTTTPPPVLPRIWPPVELGASVDFGVWCGASAIAGAHGEAARLEPLGIAGLLAPGVDGVDRRCVSFRAPGATAFDAGAPASVAPPAVPGAAPVALLDPRPFAVEAPPAPAKPLDCEAGERRFGPACVRVLDDRLVGRAPDAPVLFAVHGEGIDSVFSTNPGDPFVLTPLPASTEVHLAVSAIDTAGHVARTSFHATTGAPRPHVVVSEVLAHPVGPEPAEEWVEIVNGGLAPADLTGYLLLDPNGATALPAATLAPGQYALIVGEDYSDDDGFDAPAAPGTLLLHVPRVGKDGLSNDGEPLVLRDGSGATVSTFPAAPKPETGLSVARTTPSAPDGVATSFVLATPTPGRANQPAP